jgi:hypothetical protein
VEGCPMWRTANLSPMIEFFVKGRMFHVSLFSILDAHHLIQDLHVSLQHVSWGMLSHKLSI